MGRNSNEVEKYSRRFLPEVKRAIKALDHEIRLAVVSALEQHGDLSFSELRSLLKISKSDFYYHLKQLMMGGIIRGYTKEKMEISPYTSYYGLTDLGKSFITALSRALLPKSLREYEPRPAIEAIWMRKLAHYLQVPEKTPQIQIKSISGRKIYLKSPDEVKGTVFSRVIHLGKRKVHLIAGSKCK